MHAVELARLASVFARSSSALVSLGNRFHRDAVQAYWLNSRFRHDSWSCRLATHRQAIQDSGVSFRNSRWHEIVPVMQEVLLSEPLTRCIAYLATVLEERPDDALTPHERGRESELTPLAQSALASHIEARHRCLHLIVFGKGLSVEHAVKLNRMRRALEVYTDQLISVMRPIANLADYAFDPEKVARSQRELASGNLPSTYLKLHTSGLSHGLWKQLQSEVDWRIANPQTNHKLSQAVLSLLPQELFDHFGVAKTHHQLVFEGESQESTGKSNDFHSPLAHPLDILYSEPRATVPSTKSKPRW